MDSLFNNYYSNQDNDKSFGFFEKIEKATELKVAGNKCFKEGDYQNALKNYHKGLLYAKGAHQDLYPSSSKAAFEVNNDEKSELTTVLVDLHNNIAVCLMKKTSPRLESALDHCNHSISYNCENSKAWYRKAQTLLLLNRVEDAMSSALRASRLCNGKDSCVQQLLQKIKAKEKEEQQAFNDMFRNTMIRNY